VARFADIGGRVAVLPDRGVGRTFVGGAPRCATFAPRRFCNLRIVRETQHSTAIRHGRGHPPPVPGHGRACTAASKELIALQGDIVKGTVVRLEEYGAFVEVQTVDGEPVTGLVHVSEVDSDFVENIYAYLAEGDEVDVKIMDIKEDGKVDLSIKRAQPDWEEDESVNLRSKLDKDFNKRLRRFMHKSQMIQGEARRQRRGRVVE
jgi:S1 RNA binding domain protein